MTHPKQRNAPGHTRAGGPDAGRLRVGKRRRCAESEPPVVTVSQPLEKDITDYDQYTGRIEAAETVEVRVTGAR